MSDFEWHRSSFCASGACVEVAVSEFGDVLVSDSKLGGASPFRAFSSGAWSRVLDDIRDGWLPDRAAWLANGGIEWGPLEFTAEEWDAFERGVKAGEFDYDKLCTRGVEAGSGEDGSGQAATGAGAIAVPPVPVAAHEPVRADQLTPGRIVVIPMTESLETVTRVRVSGSYVTVHTNGTGPNFSYQWRAGDEISAVVAVPPVPVAAQPRYILDKDAVLELVQRYGEACKSVTKTYFRDVTDHRAAKANAADLLDAIRAALTPVPASEPEPAWGSGPLVKHVTETPGQAVQS